MPGLHKMNKDGLQFIGKLFEENPSVAFTQLLVTYNENAVKQGWRCLRSSGTLAYHLQMMGLYSGGSRAPLPNKDFGHRLIRVSEKLKKEMCEKFKLSNVSIWGALHFRTQSEAAKEIRNYALSHGGKLFEEAENPYEKVVTIK